MNIVLRRAQQEMNLTNINPEVGYPGPHEQIIGVGGEHNMIFRDGSDVPF